MKKFMILLFFICISTAVLSGLVYGHCDTLDGPVIKDAQIALEKGDVTPVLKWVKQENENRIQLAFDKTLEERKQNKESADIKFFEILVNVHRTGEGADFSGLKPAGAVEPAVAKADKAIEEQSVDELAEKIGNVVIDGIEERFAELMEAIKYKDDSVEAGRKYVGAYVEYVHYVEKIHNLATDGVAHAHE